MTPKSKKNPNPPIKQPQEKKPNSQTSNDPDIDTNSKAARKAKAKAEAHTKIGLRLEANYPFLCHGEYCRKRFQTEDGRAQHIKKQHPEVSMHRAPKGQKRNPENPSQRSRRSSLDSMVERLSIGRPRRTYTMEEDAESEDAREDWRSRN